MQIATFNVNSVRARLPIVIDWLKANEPDALCMQETKVDDDLFPVKEFEEIGYRVAFRGKGGHAGVAIASREELKDVAFGIDDGGERDEERLVRGSLGGIHIINTYVPQGRDVHLPQYQYKLEWFSRLSGFFSKHYTPKQKVLWCGDLNVAPKDIDVHDPKRLRGHVGFNPEVSAALEKVTEWGFIDVFRRHHPEPGLYSFFDYRAPGAVAKNKGWRVDLILVTKALAEKCTDCRIDLEPRRRKGASDHTVVAAEFDV